MAIRSNHDAQRVLQFGKKESGPRRFDNQPRQPDTNAPSPSDISVRPFHLLESAALAGFDERIELRFPESSFIQPGAVRLILRRLFRAENTDQPIYLATDTHTKKKLGALQCRQQPADDRWHLQFMALANDTSETFSVPVALLEHAVSDAGSRGARRVLARVDVDSPVTAALRAVGFAAYTREQVFRLGDAHATAIDSRVRVQQKSDVWSVHQLYLHSTPREVQNAEALTSHAWDVDTEGRTQRGWFIANNSDVVAFIRVRTERQFHVLDVMTTLLDRAVVAPLLGSVMATLRNETSRPVFLLLRGYQAELSSSVIEYIGEPVAEQFLMVKYTTAPAARRAAETFELLRPVESDPQRVPSFCVRDIHEQC